MNGAKIMELKVPSANVRFIDSLNFFPMALAKLPKTFGFTELKKGFFPHFFNTRANEQYVGPIPAIEYYDPDGMKPEVQREFLRWHDTQKDVVFDIHRENMEKYGSYVFFDAPPLRTSECNANKTCPPNI